MASSEAQQRANMKYRKKAYDRLELNLPKGEKEIIQEFAAKQRKSLNAFVNEAIIEKMERDAIKPSE